MKHKTLALGAAILLLSGLSGNTALAHDGRSDCRNYDRTYSMNGRWERGYATACHNGRGKWEITKISAPIEYRTSLIEVVKRDVFNIGGLSVTLSSSSYEPVRYYNVPTRTKVRYVAPPNHNKHHKHKHKNEHKGWYKYDRDDHKKHDHDDRRRGHRH